MSNAKSPLKTSVQRISTLVAVMTVACAASTAVHAEWRGGFVQGDHEFFSDQGDMRVYISCPAVDDASSRFSSVWLQRLSTRNDISKFTMTVNGHTYDGPMDTKSRVDSDNFRAFMEDLRKSNLTVKYALGTIVYPKANAAKVIPVAAPTMPCNTML